MSYNLFIDDERYPADDGRFWVLARSSKQAINLMKQNGFPSFISFDHDLGGDDTSILVIKWMIEQVLDAVEARTPVPVFPMNFYVHSQNPVGAKNIQTLMESFITFTRNQ